MGNKIIPNMKSEIKEIEKKLNQNFLEKIVKLKNYKTVDFRELTFFKDDPDFLTVKSIMDSHKSKINNDKFQIYKNIDINLSRAISCFVCSGIGDALGTHTEFLPVKYNREPNLIENFGKNNFLKDGTICNLGEFSDDTSMALCIADSLLFKDFIFDGSDLQIKFINWWYSSYNNCLNPRRRSHGLGGNISYSMDYFIEAAAKIENVEENMNKLPKSSVAPGRKTNGNGSLMRLAPVPIAFASDPKLLDYALKYSSLQSKVTHTGEEAAECCQLLTHLIIKFIQRKGNSFDDIKSSMDEALSDFNTNEYSIECLKNSKMEDEEIFQSKLISGEYDKNYSKSAADRNWNWKDKNFRYSPTREELMPDYVGSYCMDALSMALHLSYYSYEPREAILRAVNMGGDCDTVGAITGMIVGSYYGLDESILSLYDGIKPFDKYKLAYMAFKLYTSPKNI